MKNEQVVFGTYLLKTIDASYVYQMMGLQEALIDSFPPEKKKFIRYRSEEEMIRSVSPENVGVGVFDGQGELVGTFFLVEHSGALTDGILALCPFTRTYLGEQKGKKIGVLCAAMVHPDHQQQRLMQAMMGFLQQHAARNAYDFLVAAVATTNEPSIRCFNSAGFSQAGQDHADSDGRSLVFLAQQLKACQDMPVLPSVSFAQKAKKIFPIGIPLPV